MRKNKRRRKKRKHDLGRIMISSLIGIIAIGMFFVLLIKFCNENIYEQEYLRIVIEPEIIIKTEDSIEKSQSIGSNDYVYKKEQLEENVTSEMSDAEIDLFYENETNQLMAEMTLWEKVCQMFIVTPEQLTGVKHVTASGKTTKESLQQFPVGGLVYFGANLQDAKQAKSMLANIQEFVLEIENMPLFICVDEEGGRVARIGGNPVFGVEKIGPMAEIQSADEAYTAGWTIGKYLADLGFNVDFAPDCDVLTNPDNTVIGNRAFGSDAKKVKEYAEAFSDGLHECGILSTYKHFPGHGATANDTHKGFAYTDKTLDELVQAELIPFANAQVSGVDMVMVSHISVPTILGDNKPCSLSYYMVTEVLKGELGYDGLVVTDAMNMGAITDTYTDSNAVIKAILAGNDLILTPSNFKKAVRDVVAAVESGEIEEDRIDESVRKIIRKKLEREIDYEIFFH